MKKLAKSMSALLGSITLAATLVSLAWVPVTSATTDTMCSSPIDVMLVFDRSDSMSYDSPWPDVQPLGNAQQGTLAFIDELNVDDDRVGLVDFYEYAELSNGLTTDFNAVRANVNWTWVEGWTNVGAGLDLAHTELNANGRDDVKQIIVLLSDGNPTRPAPSSAAATYALQQATEAKGDGIEIFTLGWGDGVNPTFLQAVASEPSNYYYAPTSAGIADAYRAIAETMCEPENEKPEITLAYSTLILGVGDVFDPLDGHATATDTEDGDITEDLEATGSVNTAIAGTYTVEYNVEDSEGLAADPKTLTVIVMVAPVCSDAIDNDGDGYIDADDIGCWTDPDDPETYDPEDPDETNDPIYGNYCGDGIINQEWEQCDTGNILGVVGCSVQCQYVVPQCTENVFARVVVTNTQNNGDQANMTNDIYLGNSSSPIPSGTWFAVYYDGEYIDDTDINGYENVPGLAIQRQGGEIITRLFGSHANDGTWEHVEGYVEFSNSEAGSIANDDDIEQNKMENWGDTMVAQKAVLAGKDAAWITDGISYFWMTVTTADDSYITSYETPICEPEDEYATVIAQKIVCEDESYLPNWGGVNVESITQETVNDFLETVNADGQVCELVDWDFQWAPQGTENPGDNTGATSSPWTSFSGSTLINLDDIAGDDYIWVREVWNDDYIPFTGVNTTENVSAEIYCHIDTVNYDNYDRVDGPLEAGETYYCVAFNVHTDVPPAPQCSDDDDNDGDQLSDENDPGCWVDPGDPETYDPEDDDEYNEPAPICEDVVVVSDTTDMADGDQAVAAWVHHTWTTIKDALWIWKSYLVSNPAANESTTFTKDFLVTGVPEDAELIVAADNTYIVKINGSEVVSDMNGDNFTDAGKDTYTDISGYLHAGTNTISFIVANIGIDGSDAMGNPAGLAYRLTVGIEGNTCNLGNTAPEILGADAPLILHVGDSDLLMRALAGVTATDTEDGDITPKIIVDISAIDTATTGTTSITYTVDDNGYPAGLNIMTDTVVREVEVVVSGVNLPPVANAGADKTATATASVIFDGTASYDTDGTIVSYEWNFADGATSTGATTTHAFSATGTYAVSLTVTDDDGATSTDTAVITIVSATHPQCSDGLDNDGDGTIDEDDLTCYRDDEYDPLLDNEENQKPVITLAHPTLSLTVGDSFNALGGGHATANDVEDGNITSGIFATSTVNTAVAGTYTVEYGVKDSEGLAADPKTMTVTVNAKTIIRGGGGGGGGYVQQVITITNEKVVYLGDGKAKVTWNTNIPATSRVVYGDNSVIFKNDKPLYGYDATNQKDETLIGEHSMVITGLTNGVQYYFRPISDKAFVTEVAGNEVTYGFAPIVGPTQCNYLLEYIKLGAVNNPLEVEKLERFLNLYENENLTVNGVYEQVDYEAVERFQNKYFGDILAPWGHDAPTGYVYITTKKKVNEIFCEREFPLNAAQESEIGQFKAFLLGLKTAFAAEGGNTSGGSVVDTVDYGDTVGLGDGEGDSAIADAGDEAGATRGLLANIMHILGFGGADDDTGATSTDGTQLAEGDTTATGSDDMLAEAESQKNLAAVVFGGVMSVATSYWFIFLLAIFAVILFIRIRGAEQE